MNEYAELSGIFPYSGTYRSGLRSETICATGLDRTWGIIWKYAMIYCYLPPRCVILDGIEHYAPCISDLLMLSVFSGVCSRLGYPQCAIESDTFTSERVNSSQTPRLGSVKMGTVLLD